MAGSSPKARSKLRRLSAAAAASGVSPAQLQHYCYMQVIRPRHHSEAGQRLFDAADVKRIRMVKLLNDSGYPLREIREIFIERR